MQIVQELVQQFSISWAAAVVSVCGLLGLVFLCATCLAIVRMTGGTEGLRDFAEVVSASRRWRPSRHTEKGLPRKTRSGPEPPS